MFMEQDQRKAEIKQRRVKVKDVSFPRPHSSFFPEPTEYMHRHTHAHTHSRMHTLTLSGKRLHFLPKQSRKDLQIMDMRGLRCIID